MCGDYLYEDPKLQELLKALASGRWIALSSQDEKFIAKAFLEAIEHINDLEDELSRCGG